MQHTSLDKNYWNSLYATHQTAWDIGSISNPIKDYINQLTNKNISILIPGCGNAYEASYLLQQGFTNITLIDIASAPVESIKIKLYQYEGKYLRVNCGNFFDLHEKFDLIIEQTFFCALDPLLRNDYADKMFGLLNNTGKLVGVLFNRSFEAGPPFGGSREEYLPLFSQKFNIKVMEQCYNSIAPGFKTELFIILERKA